MMRFGRAMLQLMAVFAEWSSRITSERIKAIEIEGIVVWDKRSALAQTAAASRASERIV